MGVIGWLAADEQRDISGGVQPKRLVVFCLFPMSALVELFFFFLIRGLASFTLLPCDLFFHDPLPRKWGLLRGKMCVVEIIL